MTQTIASLVGKIKAFFAKTKKRKAVLGVSGGVDSALTCFLLAKALGPKNVIALHLPYFADAPAEKNAEAVARVCGIKLSIKRIVDAIALPLKCDKKRKGNVMARVRMIVLYDFAKKHDGLVAGCGNKSELSVGYFTKHGDGAADFLPIGSLLKRDVKRLALEAGIPREIVFQTPSAGLWPSQTDEGELRMVYGELDGILELLGKNELREAKAIFGQGKVSKVLELLKYSEHKRKTPEVL